MYCFEYKLQDYGNANGSEQKRSWWRQCLLSPAVLKHFGA